jgi:hypothetical protein
VVTEVLVGLRDRGLDVTRPLLVVLDGAKALRRAVTEVFDHPVIQRCQLHKLRNVCDRLPDALAPPWPGGCAAPTTIPTRWSPRPSWRRWRGSWTAPTLAPLQACARAVRRIREWPIPCQNRRQPLAVTWWPVGTPACEADAFPATSPTLNNETDSRCCCPGPPASAAAGPLPV